MNEAVYERVRERVKEYNLTEQEIKAIDTARQQLNTHSKNCRKHISKLVAYNIFANLNSTASLGGFTGGLVAFFLGIASTYCHVYLK